MKTLIIIIAIIWVMYAINRIKKFFGKFGMKERERQKDLRIKELEVKCEILEKRLERLEQQHGFEYDPQKDVLTQQLPENTEPILKAEKSKQRKIAVSIVCVILAFCTITFFY